LMLATTIHKSNTTPHHQVRATTTTPNPPNREDQEPAPTTNGEPAGPVASGPNSVLGSHPPNPQKTGAPRRDQRLSVIAPSRRPLQPACSSRPTHPHWMCFSWCSLERR